MSKVVDQIENNREHPGIKLSGGVSTGNIEIRPQKIPLELDDTITKAYADSLKQSDPPKGLIFMYVGKFSDIPPGYKLCDGSGGTLDLRDRFVYGSTSQGSTGGSASSTVVAHTHGAPAHAHNITIYSAGAHTHSVSLAMKSKFRLEFWTGWGSFGKPHSAGATPKEFSPYTNGAILGRTQYIDNAHSHSASMPGSSITSSESSHVVGNNIPEYYKLAFIQIV